MAFVSNGSFLPSTATSADPVVVTVNRTVAVGDTALVYIFNSANNVTITGVTDSSGNSWDVLSYVNSAGNIAIAVATIATQLSSGSSTVSVNMSSATQTIVRGSSYSGITSSRSSQATKYAAEANYSLSWTSTEPGIAFVAFGFPYDYSFADDEISGWTQVFVTDDLVGLHSQQVFRKAVSAGSVVCGNTGPSIPYLAAGLVLPYTKSGFGQAVVVL